MDSIFKAFLIPGEGKTITLGFELNGDHPVLAGLAQSPAIDSWRKNIWLFPQVIQELLSNSSAIIIGGQHAHLTSSINFPLATDLWRRFTGFDPTVTTQSNWPSLGPVLPIPVIKTPPVTLYPQSPIRPGAPIFSIPASGYDSIPNYYSMLEQHPMVFGLEDPVHEGLMQGIERAYETNAAQMMSRNRQIIDAHNLSHEVVNFTLPAGLRSGDGEKDKIMAQMSGILALVNSYHDAVNNNPAFILEAINKLNGVVKLRFFLGTLINFDVELPQNTDSIIINDLNALIRNLSTSGLDPNYFDCSVKTWLKPAAMGSLAMFFPATIDSNYDNFYHNTFIRLGNLCQVKTYEIQSVVNSKAKLRQQFLTSGNPSFDHSLSNADYQTITANNFPLFSDVANIKAARRLVNIGRRINNQVADTQTKGHQLFITDTAWLKYNPADSEAGNPSGLHEHNLLAGYSIFVRIKNGGNLMTDWTSLTKLEENLAHHSLSNKFVTTELPILIDSAVNYMDDTAINGSVVDNAQLQKGIVNGFLFTWDGTIISSRNPLSHQEKGKGGETAQFVAKFEAIVNSLKNTALETTAVHQRGKKILGVDWFPLKRRQAAEYSVQRRFLFGDDVTTGLLRFNNQITYEYIMAAGLINGFHPVTEESLRALAASNPAELQSLSSPPEKFLRHEHINEVQIALDNNIYTDNQFKSPLPNHLGETSSDLVVRTGTLVYNSSCTRYILPPQVPSFQTYLWYDYQNGGDFMRSRDMGADEIHPWYRRYQCEHTNATEYQDSLAECQRLNALLPAALATDCANNGCTAGCRSFCGGTTQPAVYDGTLYYLPDPIVTGFIIRFFVDEDCLLPADAALYPTKYCPFSGNYPQLPGWSIELSAIGASTANSNVSVNYLSRWIGVKLQRGGQLFAEIVPAFDQKNACFFPAAVNKDRYEIIGSYQDGLTPKTYYVNTLYAAIKKISFTHASQTPVVTPVIKSLQLERFRKGSINKTASSLLVTAEITFEHLNLWRNLVLPDTQPTGELDLYASWDDYAQDHNGPSKTKAQKYNPNRTDDGYIYLGRVVFRRETNSGKSYQNKLKLTSGGASQSATGMITFEVEKFFDVTYFTDAAFSIRNTSKFSRYFTSQDYSNLTDDAKEQFSLWSDDYPVVAIAPNTLPNYQKIQYRYDPSVSLWSAYSNYLFNNIKPASPEVAKIIPLIVKDEDNYGQVQYRHNRIRIYFKSLPLTGKNNRIGILIDSDKSIYKDTLKNFRSIAGRDIVTDPAGDVVKLTNGSLSGQNIMWGHDKLEKENTDKFIPLFDGAIEHAIDPIGLVSYIAYYDDQQQLWYIDTELSITNTSGKELHNPFVQLGLVDYQPRSANYGHIVGCTADTSAFIEEDYRISAPVKADFFCIFPQRTFQSPAVLFNNRSGDHFSLAGCVNSLYRDGNGQMRSEFVLSVQEHSEGDFWRDCASVLTYLGFKTGSSVQQPQSDGVSRVYHALFGKNSNLLPSDPSSNFEVQVNLFFNKKIFRKYRVVIYELDVFDSSIKTETLEQLGAHELFKEPDLRPRETYIFYK